MAYSANTGDYTATRGDMYIVDPRALIVDHRKNISRGGMPPDIDDEFIDFARSLIPKDYPSEGLGGNGQEQPIVVRPLPDRRLEVISGWRRSAAGLWLIESGECPDFKIKYVISRVNDKEAALDNIVENLHRLAPKPIQMAHAIRILTEAPHFMAVEEISKKLNRKVQWVNETLNYVMLPEPIQEAVKAKELSVAAAKELGDLPAPEAVTTFNAMRDSGERISATTVKDAKRAKREAAVASGNVEPDAVAPVKRSLRHIVGFLETATGPGENRNGKLVAEEMLAFLDGTRSETQLQATWDRIFPAPIMRAGKPAKKTAAKASGKKTKANATMTEAATV